MSTKPLFYLGCCLAATLAIPTVNAGPHHGGGNRVAPVRSGGMRMASMPARFSGGGTRQFVGGNRIGRSFNGQRFNRQHFTGGNFNGQHVNHWNGQHWANNHWNNNHWNNNWNWHHHHHNNSFVFFDVGFPFWGWWGYPYSYDYYPYSYGYYGAYPYGYYGSGYYGSYNYNYGNGYGYDNGSGYGNGGYSNGYDAKVAELQRRLANAGYYRGEIDGIWGSRTQYALKAYRHDHPNGNGDYGNGGSSPTLRHTPYSPPPVTNEPTPTE